MARDIIKNLGEIQHKVYYAALSIAGVKEKEFYEAY